jgi:hypothetical protein
MEQNSRFLIKQKDTKAQRSQRGQAVVELAFQIPLMLLLMFGCVQLARVFYVYHSLHKAVRGGAGLMARSVNVNYCDSNALTAARNFIVYGNPDGGSIPVVSGLTPELIEFIPERRDITTTGVTQCDCAGENLADGCDIAGGGRAPDFIVVRLVTGGFPLTLPFPFITVGPINLNVSVRMPLTGS